ncbi:MAG TPA: hypothetical protein VK821_10320 [Dehalococcoidia bacterium]|nr:hypothetical protein [Dehalococcoidia bacterium]
MTEAENVRRPRVRRRERMPMSAASSDSPAVRAQLLESERQMVARELRDETAQVLSSALLHLAAVGDRPDRALGEAELDGLQVALRRELSRVLAIDSGFTVSPEERHP